jgi:hypothetical protein
MLRSALTRFVSVFVKHFALGGAAVLVKRFAPALRGGAAVLLLAACSQGESQPCQIDGDCDDNLICLRARASDRGTCENPKTVEQDSGTPAGDAGELPLPDAGSDDAGSEDGGSTGQSSSEDAG